MSVRNTSGKSNYSVDEMFDRLKDSQARKEGRSRRRRSRQPRVEQRRKLLWAVAGAVGLTLLGVIALIAFFMVSKFRYQSEGFRTDVNTRVSEILGMEAEFGPFTVDGTTISSRRARASASEGGGLLREIDAEALQGKLAVGSFISSDWRVDPLRIYRLAAVFELPETGASTAGLGGASLLRPLMAGLGLSSRPSGIALSSVQVREIDLAFGGSQSDRSLVGATCNAEVFGSGVSFQGGGGFLRWGAIPPLKLASVLGKLDGKRVEITKARLSMDDQDEIVVKGSVDVAADGGYDLDCEMGGIAVDRLLGEAWWKRIEGLLDAQFKMTRNFAGNVGRQIDGKIRISSFLLKELPLLDTLAVYTAEPGFAFVDLPTVTAAIRSDGDVLRITDFEAQRSGLVRIGGDIEVGPHGELGGTLELGVPAASFDKLRSGLPDFFVIREDGFAWADAALSGTIDNPREDLGDKLRDLIRLQRSDTESSPTTTPSAPGTAPEGAGPGDPGSSADPAADAPRPPAGSALDQLEKAFEQLID